MHKLTQDDGSSWLSASTSSATFQVSAAPLTLLDDLLHHYNSPAKRSCALATTVRLALHVRKSVILLAAEEKMVSYTQFGFGRSALPAYENVTSEVRSSEA